MKGAIHLTLKLELEDIGRKVQGCDRRGTTLGPGSFRLRDQEVTVLPKIKGNFGGCI